jgi:hypothetical protein
MWDGSLCEDTAVRFENIVASNLLKDCHRQEDGKGDRMDQTFVRDSQKRENARTFGWPRETSLVSDAGGIGGGRGGKAI